MNNETLSGAEHTIDKARAELKWLTKKAWIIGREIRHTVRSSKAQQLAPVTRRLMDDLDELQTRLAAFASQAYHHDRAALAELQTIAKRLRESEDT